MPHLRSLLSLYDIFHEAPTHSPFSGALHHRLCKNWTSRPYLNWNLTLNWHWSKIANASLIIIATDVTEGEEEEDEEGSGEVTFTNPCFGHGNGALLPHPEKCAAYYICDHGEAKTRRCSTGTVFNPRKSESNPSKPVQMLCPRMTRKCWNDGK